MFALTVIFKNQENLYLFLNTYNDFISKINKAMKVVNIVCLCVSSFYEFQDLKEVHVSFDYVIYVYI